MAGLEPRDGRPSPCKYRSQRGETGATCRDLHANLASRMLRPLRGRSRRRTRMRNPLAAATLAIAFCHSTLVAQNRPTGRLEGTVIEKLATRSATAAWISLVQLEPAGGATISARPDVHGQFHLDSLPAGRYLVQVGVPTLDSLELALPPHEVRIAGGETARAEFPLPSGARLRDAVCTGVKLADGKAVIAGRVSDADTDRPLADADVVASWTEISFDKATLKATTERRVAVAKSGPQGEYRMCGVPSGRPLRLQLQQAGRAGPTLRVSVTDEEGVVVRDLSLSATTAPTLVALDSAARIAAAAGDSSLAELQLTGTARLTGTVRGAEGRPVANVEVRVRDAYEAAVTDEAGRFTIGGLPAGTQLLVVRELGYALAELPVELRPERTVTRDVQLVRIARLDSVKVLATRPPYAEFEKNRRTNPMGKFMTLSEIQRRDAHSTADLLRVFGSFTVSRHGLETWVLPKGAPSMKCKKANVVIDGIDGLSVDDVEPKAIAGIEAYSDPTTAPARYAGNAECGVIVIWLRTVDDRARPEMKNGLQWNGYP